MSKHMIIVPVYNRVSIIRDAINGIDESIGNQTDILVVDDGSEDGTPDRIKTSDHIRLLTHEASLGYGAALSNGLHLAGDLGYEYAVTLDIAYPRCYFAFTPIIMALNEGNDIVTCSRMSEIDRGVASEDYSAIDTGNIVADTLNSTTGYSLIDPFSPYKGYRIRALECLNIEEYDESAIIQIWIQAAHYRLRMKEIYSADIDTGYIHEGEYLENDVDHYLSFIESERFLHPIEPEQ
jgi:glycosyltransferase involved in cell wall biosynthesis